MLAGVGNAKTLGPRQPAETPVKQLMEMLAGGARRIVVEDAGEVIGTVTPDSIIARMSAEDQDGRQWRRGSGPRRGRNRVFFDGLLRGGGQAD